MAAADPVCELRSPRVVIEYCVGCKWLLRAAWYAQELLSTFGKELGEVALQPGRDGGVFNVWINDELVWCRSVSKSFPEAKELKQLIRDRINPERSLGHSDVQGHTANCPLADTEVVFWNGEQDISYNLSKFDLWYELPV